MSRVLLVVPFVLAAITTLFATTLTALAANTCAGIWGSNTYPGTVTNIKGNVVVPDGASCTLCFAKVSGDVQSAIGVNFNATTYPVVGNYITGAFVNRRRPRSRPLCPYQQEARLPAAPPCSTILPAAGDPAELANASNDACIEP